MRHIVGLPNPDISEIMGISLEAVESLVSRGKQALARTLAPQKKHWDWKMTNKDFKYPPLNERELGLLFDEVQKTTPEISKQFLERLQNQAI